MKKILLLIPFLLLLMLIVACRQCGTLLSDQEESYLPVMATRSSESLLPSLSGVRTNTALQAAADGAESMQHGFRQFSYDDQTETFSYEELRYSPADADGISRLLYVQIKNGTMDQAAASLRGEALIYQYCFNTETGEARLFGSRKAEYYAGLFEQTILDTSSDESLRRSSYREEGTGLAWFEGGRYATESSPRFSKGIETDKLGPDSPYIDDFLSLDQPLEQIPYIVYRLPDVSQTVAFDFCTTLTVPEDLETWAVNLPQAWYRETELLQ